MRNRMMTIDESLQLMLEIEDDLWTLSSTKELISPSNFDFMFLLGVYAPIIAALCFQLFSAFYHVLRPSQ